MPILETYEVDDPRIAALTFYGADLIAVGETFARLSSFLGDESRTMDVFRCDQGSLASLRKACAKIAGLQRDRSSTYLLQKVTQDNRTTWKRLRKGENPRKGAETREQTVHTYSGNAQREGVRLIRETFAVAVERAATLDDGTVVVRLARGESQDSNAETV